jgi:predicted nucleic acid-binding protein
MSDKYFVDTNVLVYAHDRLTGAKHQPARELVDELWRSGLGVLSTQVLQELCFSLRRKSLHPLSIDETRTVIEDYASWEVIVNKPDSILRALEIESLYKIGFWDALILQSAEAAGASVLYTEDLSASQTYGSVRVVNPFQNV